MLRSYDVSHYFVGSVTRVARSGEKDHAIGVYQSFLHASLSSEFSDSDSHDPASSQVSLIRAQISTEYDTCRLSGDESHAWLTQDSAWEARRFSPSEIVASFLETVVDISLRFASARKVVPPTSYQLTTVGLQIR